MATSVVTSTRTGGSGSARVDGISGRSSSSAASTALRAAENGIWGSFLIIQKKHEPHSWSVLVGAGIKFLQLAAFALSQHAGYGWFDATVRPIQVVAELTTIPGYTNWMTPETYLGLYYTALAWVLLFVGLFVWATASFIRQKWPVLWPLRVLAAMGTTSATLLYIPLFYLLMSGFTCHLPQENPFWAAMGYACYTGGHLAQTVITALLTAAFVMLCVMFTLVYLDSNPVSANLAAKAHGRADFLFLIAKTALVVLVEVYPHSIGATGLAVIVLIVGCVLVATYAWTLPFTHHTMNKVMLAVVSTFTWAGACALLSCVYPTFDADRKSVV